MGIFLPGTIDAGIADVDDDAARAWITGHDARRPLRDEEGRAQVDRHGQVPIFQRHIQQVPHLKD